MHLLINRILEEELQYINFSTTLDIQQSIVEWIETLEIEGTVEETLEIEGTVEETSKIEGTMEETLEMIEGIMKGTAKLRKIMRNKEI